MPGTYKPNLGCYSLPLEVTKELDNRSKKSNIKKSTLVAKGLEYLFKDADVHGGLFYWMREEDNNSHSK